MKSVGEVGCRRGVDDLNWGSDACVSVLSVTLESKADILTEHEAA